MDDTLFPALQKAFRCQISGVKSLRNVYLIRTSRGMWVVKGYKDQQKAEWVTQLAQVLQDNGFYHTVQYVSYADGQYVFPHQNKFYTVMKAIDGREANNADLHDVKRSATTLARFHLAAQGFPTLVTNDSFKPSIIDKWEGRLAQFMQISAKISKRGPNNRLEQIIQAMAKEAERDATKVVEQLYKLPLVSETEQALRYGTLAHRDVASHNFMITPGGSCYLIDLDTVDCDMQILDVVQLMSRMMLLQGYKFDSFMQAIEAYTKVNSLSDTQIWMIFQMLRFPDNLMREVTGLYMKRPGYQLRGVTQLLQLERRYRRERRAFLHSEPRIFQRLGSYYYVG